MANEATDKNSTGRQMPEIKGSKEQVNNYFGHIIDEKVPDIIAAELKNLGLLEEVERVRETLKTHGERSTDDQMKRFRGAMEGRSPRRRPTQKSNLWFLKGQDYDPVYEPGSGQKFSDALPFMFKAAHSAAGTGSLNWNDVVRYASDGIKHGERTFQNKEIAGRLEKALEASSLDLGGGLIPEELSADFIGFLYDSAVFRQAGARTIEMPGGHLNFGRQNQTATAYWVDERAEITESNQKFEKLVLDAKKLGVLVAMSNDLVRRAPQGLEQIVRDDMVTVAQLAEDEAFIRGSGEGTPKGVLNSVASGNTFDSAGSTTGDIVSDLAKAIYKVRKGNIPFAQPGWIMSVRTHAYLMQLRDADDNLTSFMGQLSEGMLMGYPVFVTNQIPTNLGSGSDETEIYFGDFSQALIGETLQLQVDQTVDANIAGNTDLFSRDMQALRIIHEVDFALRHNESFSVIEAFAADAGFDS